MLVLGVDIGTTSMKMGVFRLTGDALEPIRQFSQGYAINIYNDGLCGDIEQHKWQEAFVAGCREMEELVRNVEVISLSGTTPGLTAMAADGTALYPAILMLDQRSRSQAQRIIDTIGLDRLLETTANMPVAGGCSLAGILWLQENHPDLFRKTYKFGHSNTYLAHWLTGAYAIDPSSASLTALYNTTRNDLTWNEEIARAFDLSLDRLPQLVPAHQSVGKVHSSLAKKLGLRREPQVLIGGNDAVLAAYSVGIQDPGDTINVNGTCEISLVCLPQCLPSRNYNIRAHVLPGRWLTLHVMNAGGKALEWFKSVFCSELSDEDFYRDFLPRAVDAWLDRDSGVTYVPYLMGSRYSLDPLRAELQGLTQTTSREEILAAIVRGLCHYQKKHLDEIEQHVPLRDTIHVTGGALNPALIRAKQKWMRPARYLHDQDSSTQGAALLARLHLQNP
jgi:sugar (pentulose or hexulose) kinase